MAILLCLGVTLLMLVNFQRVIGQPVSQGNTAFDALEYLGCTQFRSIIQDAHLEETFKSAQALTLFVFNDTAYSLLSPNRIKNLYDRNSPNNLGAKEYVFSFTLTKALETSTFSESTPVKTYSIKNRKAFLNMKEIRKENEAKSAPGTIRYYMNGAMVIRPNIQAGMHIIHVIDQVLDLPLEFNAMAYVMGFNPSGHQFMFFSKIMEILQRSYLEDGEYNYNNQVVEVLGGKQVTFFIPTDEALNKIPIHKLNELQGNLRLMLDIVTLHIVPNQVLYTSLVNHNERFNTQFNSGVVVFRMNFNREEVYVTGALKGGRSVTARLNPANITVVNGVVHQIDTVLGFVYNTAIEEISHDPNTQNFGKLISAASKDVQDALTATSGVTVFVPTNEAMNAVANVYQNYMANQSLINMILELSTLQQGQYIYMMDYNGGYESYRTAVSRYNGNLIKVYNRGGDFWLEGGYVKARVIKPDIGVTNGVVHHIDAVFGVPVRDIPYTVFCEDWLVHTYIQLQNLGLDIYMRDPTLTKNMECSFSASAAAGNKPPSSGTVTPGNNINQNQNDINSGLCGEGLHRCEFTFFVPNGIAVENFIQSASGSQVINEPQRWRWLFKRLITSREKIYIDKMSPGENKTFYVDNGEEILLQIDSSGKTAYIMLEGVKAQIIHSDIGATNGVIHVISSLLFVPEDMHRDVSDLSTIGDSESAFDSSDDVALWSLNFADFSRTTSGSSFSGGQIHLSCSVVLFLYFYSYLYYI